jgi:ubiquitin C-terminal hydrolase
MNATLQCLCNVEQLQNFFLNNKLLNQNQGAVLSKGFGEVMQNLYDYKKNKKSYSPHNFKNIISNMNNLFKGIQANDSKDLILFLFEKMHEELNIRNNYINNEQNISPELFLFRQNYYSQNSSIITKTFYYETQTINECLNCHNKIISYNIQNMYIFPLEKIRQNLSNKYPKGFSYVYLEECFEDSSTTEELSGVNQISCNKCNQMSNAHLTTLYNTCPEIMTIILNRGKGIQFEVEFYFPLRINIGNYVVSKDKNTIYDLIGVLIHTGTSDMGGHFFAICKSSIDHNWYFYNDSIVQMCSQNYEYEVRSKGMPYVLFYQNLDSIYNVNNNNIELYFRTKNGNEIYFDVNNDEMFYNVVQRLSTKYSNCNFNLLRAKYYIETVQGNIFLDFNKTVKQNNLSIYSYIIIEPYEINI